MSDVAIHLRGVQGIEKISSFSPYFIVSLFLSCVSAFLTNHIIKRIQSKLLICLFSDVSVQNFGCRLQFVLTHSFSNHTFELPYLYFFVYFIFSIVYAFFMQLIIVETLLACPLNPLTRFSHVLVWASPIDNLANPIMFLHWLMLLLCLTDFVAVKNFLNSIDNMLFLVDLRIDHLGEIALSFY
jgi:hypothetical protein